MTSMCVALEPVALQQVGCTSTDAFMWPTMVGYLYGLLW